MNAVATGPLGGHLAHVLVFGVPSVLLVGWVAFKEIRNRMRRSGSFRRPSTLIGSAAAASAAAAVVHVTVCPEHFNEAFIYGLFFACAAGAQLSWAVLVLSRPSRALAVTGAVGNLAVVLLWAYTRVVGVPLGPGRGETEQIGRPDILATTFELLVVAFVVATIARPLLRPARSPRALPHS